MKLLLRRNQKAGMMSMGKVSFVLDVRAELTDEERAHIKRYKLSDTMLYERRKLIDRGSGFLGFISRIFFRITNLTISVSDLAGGKQVSCKNIVEMIGVEEEIKSAAQMFKNVLSAAAHFGGEEVMDIA